MPLKSMKISVTRIVQLVIILGAVGVAICMIRRGESSSAFDILVYLDSRVAQQEDEKDVRCWSSFCKLQMFLTGVPIDEEAIGVRIEKHMDLIESIWENAKRESPSGFVIGEHVVASILQRRFPYERGAQGATFELDGVLDPIQIAPDSLQDYSDTVEPWRLLQTWASRHTDSAGRLTLSPTFDEDALRVLHDFFKTYDLAILKHAREIAEEKKVASIDARSMAEAFSLESKLRE